MSNLPQVFRNPNHVFWQSEKLPNNKDDIMMTTLLSSCSKVVALAHERGQRSLATASLDGLPARCTDSHVTLCNSWLLADHPRKQRQTIQGSSGVPVLQAMGLSVGKI
jgi:hypothetical protein